MKCRHARKRLVELLDVTKGESMSPELICHVEKCPDCAGEFQALKQTLETLQPRRRVEASPKLKEAVMNEIAGVSGRFPEEVVRKKLSIQWWKPTLAGIFTVLVFAFLLGVLFKPVVQVYALEQTLEANHGVRFIHIINEPSGGGMGEAWAEFADNGELLHLRMDMPRTENGPKVVVWEKDKALVWFKAKNSAVIVREKSNLAQWPKSFFDPKLIVEELHEKESAGEVRIETKEPSVDGGPIVLTVQDSPTSRTLFKVDPDAKLLQEIEKYRLEDGEYELVGRTTYLGYNEPIDPETFVLDLPEDIQPVDQTTQEIGLVQGDLSDEEIAAKVVREFFEALIGKDYAKAGKLMGGTPAEKMEEFFGTIDYVKIVSIGEPTPHEKTKSLRVPCKVEVKHKGETSVFEPHGPFVRQVHGQPDRWCIIGGI